MADRVQFQKKLGELLAVAASQNNKMTSQEVQAFFQDDNLTDEQMNLVHEFLMSQKVEVIGYTGTIENTEKTEQEEKDTLSQQEKDYVAEYLIDIEKMAKQDVYKRQCKYHDHSRRRPAWPFPALSASWPRRAFRADVYKRQD